MLLVALCLGVSRRPRSTRSQLSPLQPPANSPNVVFIGDYITYEWAGTFAANPPNFRPGCDHANRPAVEPKPYAALELLNFLIL
jgi:hypothetical protein